MDRFKFRIWDIKQQKYRQRTHHDADTCLDCLSGKVLYGEGIEIYGEEDDKDVILEQSTGLKDKNGNLIYDGDIVQMSYPYYPLNKYLVKWGDCCWELWVKNGFVYVVYEKMSQSMEVVGNIHENADLLGEE